MVKRLRAKLLRLALALSVRLELQADCYAGLWAHHADKARHVVEPGDIDEALGAASAIGDDRMQRATQGYVVPESFTHGTARQRNRGFNPLGTSHRVVDDRAEDPAPNPRTEGTGRRAR